MTTFSALQVPTFLTQSLERMSITAPTPIQAAAIPPALKGLDVLASAQTGTGKTLAFLLPILTKLDSKSSESALIMTPTRELAVQIKATIDKILGKNASFKTALLIGGEAMPKQLDQLRRLPHLIIGTPGRINDHLRRKSLRLSETKTLVLDEIDRMLDMGFSEQIDIIIKLLPTQRQTLMFSATLPPSIVKISQKYLNNPERIAVGSTSQPIDKIKQDTRHVECSEKFTQLVKELDTREGSIIVFVKTKRSAEQIAVKLRSQNHSVNAIHGDLRQNKRDQVIRSFRNQKSRIMIATDIAARGLDVPHIQHVINYDLPHCPEDFIHRIGRTARAGATGEALSFISSEDRRRWRMIHKLLFPNAPQEPFTRTAGKGRDSRRGFSKNTFAKREEGFRNPTDTRRKVKDSRDASAEPFKPFSKDKRYKEKGVALDNQQMSPFKKSKPFSKPFQKSADQKNTQRTQKSPQKTLKIKDFKSDGNYPLKAKKKPFKSNNHWSKQ